MKTRSALVVLAHLSACARAINRLVKLDSSSTAKQELSVPQLGGVTG